MAPRILLSGGTLLLHDQDGRVVPRNADLLVEGNMITRIEDTITPTESMEVIECSSSLVSPGFVNTHHHAWQTQLKGVHADQNLLDYFCTGNFPGQCFTPEDIFWGQLAGLMECVDAGITTVVDHAHFNYSDDHEEEGLRATIAAGTRSIYCYCPTPTPKQWLPEFELEGNILPDRVMQRFRKRAATQPFGTSGRVTLGFAFDGMFLPPNVLRELFSEVRTAGASLITFHAVYGAMFNKGQYPSTVRKLLDNELLGPDFLLSHANNLSTEEFKGIRDSGAHISCTPLTELQMGHGDPVGLDEDCHSISSLGIDCHSICTAYMPAQMNSLLQWYRARRHAVFEQDGKWAKTLGKGAVDVFNLGTILGARAISMEDQIGSLAVGKKADIVIFDGTSPSMLAAAQRDPVAAIVMHSSIRDVSTVIIDGVVRKKTGSLNPVHVPKTTCNETDGVKDAVEWREVINQIQASRTRLDGRIAEVTGIDGTDDSLDRIRQGVMRGFHLAKQSLYNNIESQ